MSRQRISDKQKKILIEYMKSHREFAKTGLCPGPKGKINAEKMWADLSKLINASGPAQKPCWKSTWIDMKSRVKLKAIAIKNQKTGNVGTGEVGGLNQNEEVIFDLCGGRDWVGASESDEIGLPLPLGSGSCSNSDVLAAVNISESEAFEVCIDQPVAQGYAEPILVQPELRHLPLECNLKEMPEQFFTQSPTPLACISDSSTSPPVSPTLCSETPASSIKNKRKNTEGSGSSNSSKYSRASLKQKKADATLELANAIKAQTLAINNNTTAVHAYTQAVCNNTLAMNTYSEAVSKNTTIMTQYCEAISKNTGVMTEYCQTIKLLVEKFCQSKK